MGLQEAIPGNRFTKVARALPAERIRLLAIGAFIVALVGLLIAIAALSAKRLEVDGVNDQLRTKIDGFADHLQSELRWFDIPPEVLAGSHEITDLFEGDSTPARRETVNGYLKGFNAAVRGSVSYVMDANGLTLAASNFDKPDSFVGQDYGFRPYFMSAIAGGVGHYIALGVTSNALGYYVAAPIRLGGGVRGVAVVKYVPTDLLSVWRDPSSPIAIADENGVIFASSEPRFRLHTIDAHAATIREAITKRKQYPAGAPLTPLPLEGAVSLDDAVLASLNAAELDWGGAREKSSGPIKHYVVQRRQLPQNGWQVLALGNLNKAPDATVPIVTVGVLAGALALVIFLQFEQRRASRRTLALNEARLRTIAEREAKIRRLVEAHIVGIFIWEAEGRILEANDAFLRMVGYDRKDLVSGQLRWTDLTPAEWRREQISTGTVQPYEKEYIRKDGSRAPVLVGTETFEEGGSQGVAFVLDLTERKRLRQLESDLAHMNRLSMMGELTASLAHEITQPIASARNNARAALNFLDKDAPDVAELKEALGCVVGDADRAGDIIGRIRDHIKKASPRKYRFDLNEAINEVIVLARSAIAKNGVSVRTRLTEGLAPVEGDRVQVQQVILNLILNAAEAMGAVDEEARELLISTEQSRTNGVLVAVHDSGPGIDPDHIERVFEHFYTTKCTGMGMGLPICRSIIDAHGGQLSADTNEPRGAVFRFTLPSPEKSS
jgi:PAS domain S-box-containing protein